MSVINPWAAYEEVGAVKPSASNAADVSSGRRGTRFTMRLVALANETLRGGPAAKRKARICVGVVAWPVQSAVVPAAMSQTEFSRDGLRVYAEAVSKDADDIKRNRDKNLTGRDAKVRRHHADSAVIERGTVVSIVCLADNPKAKPMVGSVIDVDVSEVDLSPYGGSQSYEYQVSDIRHAFGAQKPVFVHALEPNDYAMVMVAALEAAHNMRTPVPIVYAPGCSSENSKSDTQKVIPLDNIDKRSRSMFGGEWVVALRAIPPEIDIERRALGMNRAASVVSNYRSNNPDSWPSVATNQDGSIKARDVVQIDLACKLRKPVVRFGPKDTLPGAVTADTEDALYGPETKASITVTMWGDDIAGFGVMDQEKWQRVLFRLFRGTPSIARCYCKRNEALYNWPDDDAPVGFELSVCGVPKTQSNGATNFKFEDNNGVLAFIAVGAVNAGFRVPYASVVEALKKLNELDPERYAVNMASIPVNERRRPIANDQQHPNPLETMKGASGRANVFNVLDSAQDMGAPGVDGEYYFYFVPAHGSKDITAVKNSDTDAFVMQVSPALAWYRQKAEAEGQQAADAAAGAVMVNMAAGMPLVGVKAFERPAANQKHDFLLFAVRRAWADTLKLDPLSVDNDRAIVRDVQAREARVPQRAATRAELAELVQRLGAPGVSSAADQHAPQSPVASSSSSSASTSAESKPQSDHPQLPDDLFGDE